MYVAHIHVNSPLTPQGFSILPLPPLPPFPLPPLPSVNAAQIHVGIGPPRGMGSLPAAIPFGKIGPPFLAAIGCQ